LFLWVLELLRNLRSAIFQIYTTDKKSFHLFTSIDLRICGIRLTQKREDIIMTHIPRHIIQEKLMQSIKFAGPRSVVN